MRKLWSLNVVLYCQCFKRLTWTSGLLGMPKPRLFKSHHMHVGYTLLLSQTFFKMEIGRAHV